MWKTIGKIAAGFALLFTLIGGLYAFEAYNANEKEMIAGFQRMQKSQQLRDAIYLLNQAQNTKTRLMVQLDRCRQSRRDCRNLEQELTRIEKQIDGLTKLIRDLTPTS